MSDETISMSQDPKAAPVTKRDGAWMRFLPLAVILTGLAIGYAMGWHQYLRLSYLAESREMLLDFVSDNYVLSAVGFALLYALAVAFSFPAASVLTIFGGFLFGWLIAGALVAIAATAGATTLFLAARSAVGSFLRERVGRRTTKLADGFEEDAFSYLLVLRLAPIFPFFVVNIAPALFNVPLRTYVAATFLGILPGTFAYAYLGQGVDSVLVSARQAGTEISVSDLVTPEITIAFLALATVAAIPTAVKRLRR
ncbi:TVP38/TMEM64 family protein [Oricola cellulosilytica]|nr:TVP38/TMEM64 family protein [Oricola cellulosilytica]